MEDIMNKNDTLSVNALRGLSLDMITNAKSGHPGMALSSAPIIYTLFSRHLVSNPNDPTWYNRDRFVLSAGHVSALLYATLHLAGYSIPMEQLKQFRKLDSITPGHPELGLTPGVLDLLVKAFHKLSVLQWPKSIFKLFILKVID